MSNVTLLSAICASGLAVVFSLHFVWRRSRVSSGAASPKAFERSVERYFAEAGWRIRRELYCSFIAEKANLSLYVLCGSRLLQTKFSPSASNFGRDLNYIRSKVESASPAILAILEDSVGAAYYREIAGGRAAVLSWDEIDYIKALDFTTDLNSKSESASKWAIRIIEQNADLSQRQSKAELRRGDVAAARFWAERSVALDGGNSSSHYHLSELQLTGEEFDAAEMSARRALATCSNRAPPLRRLSEIELRRRKLQGALTFAKDAVAADPTDPDSYHHLARLQMQCLDFAAAEVAARNAVTLAGDNPAYSRRLEAILRQIALSQRSFCVVEKTETAGPFN